MNTLLWILVGVLLYSVVGMALQTRGILPSSVRMQGPLTTVHTKRGRDLLEWLSQPRRFWRAWANVGVGIVLVIMVGLFFLLVQRGVSIVRNPPPPTAVNNPQNVLVIPGVNEFLPLSVAPEIVLGLLVGLIVHEGGHGLLCRVEDIDIESMGVVLLALLPIGAFVEPDEESQRTASRGGRTRMFAAGVTNNFAVTVVAFALLFGPVTGAIAVAPGAAVGGVFPNSAAADAGIDQGDRIVGFEGNEVTSSQDLYETLQNSRQASVTIELASGETVDVERSLLVTGVATDSPLADGGGEADGGIGVEETIAAVNGTDVSTERGLREALADRPIATFRTADGETVTGPTGVFLSAIPDYPLAEAGVPTDRRVVVSHIDGVRTLSMEDVSTALDGKAPGTEVSVRVYVDGRFRTYTVALAEPPEGQSGGFLGVGGGLPTSGISVNSLGVKPYPADLFLGLLSGETTGSVFQQTLLLLLLPFIGAVTPTTDFNFAGFVAGNSAFYTVDGPLAALGAGGVFLAANVLFWTGWVNLNLAFFNCIPAYPLDGGRILRTSTEAVVSRLPVENKPELTRAVTTSVGLAMLASLLLVLFGPQLLR